MTPLASAPSLAETMMQLSELVSAIDRRLPQVQRAGEDAIVNAASRLRSEALKRIREIERDIAGQASEDPRPVDTV